MASIIPSTSDLYTNNDILTGSNGEYYYRLKRYPEIPLQSTDIYVITTVGDRLDDLANTYYGNTDYWKIISVANNNSTGCSLFPTPGMQIRIPIDISDIIDSFNQINSQ
jgi:hypothetical protein